MHVLISAAGEEDGSERCIFRGAGTERNVLARGFK